MRPKLVVFTISSLFLLSTEWLAACGSDAPAKGTAPGSAGATGATAGATAAGGALATGGASASAQAGAAGLTAGASGSSGSQSGGTNGSAGVSSGGTGLGGAGGVSAGGMPSGGSPAAAGGGSVPLDFFARYEAEAPENMLTYPVEGLVTGEGSPCPAGGVKEGASCASGGKVANQILGRSPCTPPTSTTSYNQCQNKGGGVTFNGVTVPVDGTYEVTWWYHCGGSDFYGDTKCGGLDYKTGAGTGCRPHLIDVNGVPMGATAGGVTALYYQFPCYPGSWSIMHGATTALPLKAGTNTIYIHAPGAQTLDAADIDALDLHAEGQGTAPAPLWPKLVTPVVSGY